MRYFFHIRDLDGRIRDEEGSELPDMAAARREARATARDFASEDLKCGGPIIDRSIEITAGGAVIETVMVHDVTHRH